MVQISENNFRSWLFFSAYYITVMLQTLKPRYIALGKIEHAIVALDMFLDLVILEDPKIVKLNQLPDRAIVISSSTWMTLCQLMVVTVQRGSRSHFKSLLNQFDKELSFDAFLKDVILLKIEV